MDAGRYGSGRWGDSAEKKTTSIWDALRMARKFSTSRATLEGLVTKLAQADAEAIKHGRRTGYILKPGLLWGERRTIGREMEEKHRQTLIPLNDLLDAEAEVVPELQYSWQFTDYMHVYTQKGRTPPGRTITHLNASGLSTVYNDAFRKALKGVRPTAKPPAPAPTSR
eukprot:jgi/Tetstr1/454287/TSEL_041206.t1